MNSTVLSLTTEMLQHKPADKEIRAEALLTSKYVRSRVTSSALSEVKQLSSLEMPCTQCWPHLCVWWKVVVHSPGQSYKMLDNKSQPKSLIGYPDRSKEYRLLVTET